MFWDGERWVPDDGRSLTPPRPSPRRRYGDWIATGVMVLVFAGLIVPLTGANAVQPSGRKLLTAWSAESSTKVFQESNASVKYRGRWWSVYHQDYLGGKARATDGAGNKVTLRFNGAAVSWIGPIGPTRGTAKVYIDGSYVKTVNTWNSSFRPTRVLFVKSWDAVGSHRITIVTNGTRGHPTVAVDAFVVRTSLADAGTPIDNGGQAIPPATEEPAADTGAGPPAADPTPDPTPAPTPAPTTDPTSDPTTEPTPDATLTPDQTMTPAVPDPTPAPTASPKPTPSPTAPPTATPAPTPAPTPTLTPAPTPTPTTAPASCTNTVPVGGSIQSAINGAANGSTVCLTAGATYTSTTEILISSRVGITLDGRGATLVASGYHPGIRVLCSSNVTVKNLAVVGSHPSPGVYVSGTEHAHAIFVGGGSGLSFSGISARNNQGDGFYIANCNTAWADGVTIRNSSVSSNGRMGIAVVAGKNVRAESMTYHNIALALVDVEPDWNASYRQGGTDLVFSGAVSTGWIGRYPDGSSGTAAFYIGTPYGAQSGKYAPQVARISISGHEIREAKYGMWSHVNSTGGYRMSDISFTNNTGSGTWWGGDGGVIDFHHTDRFTVTGNSQSVTSGKNMYMVVSSNSTSPTVSGNSIPGGVGQYTAR